MPLSNDIACRPATTDDIPAITAIQAATWPDDDHKPLAPQLADIYVAAAADGPVGYAKLRHYTVLDGPPPGFYLGGVAVDPKWRRQGIGTLLTRCRLSAAWDKGAEIVYYFANARNEASIAMHEAMGFEELERPFFFPGVTFDGGAGTGVLFGIRRR
jgi:predicted N-acetyltransferase YhbS